MVAHRHVPKANGGDYSTVATIGLTFLQASHDATGAIQRGMNAFYAEELGNLDTLFHAHAAARDSVHGDAMSYLYGKVIVMVATNATQTSVTTQSRIPSIVHQWRFKYEFSGGKLRNLPRHDQAPGSLCTFLNRAVDNNATDYMLFVQTEDFFVDPDPTVTITYRNFDRFDHTPFAVIRWSSWSHHSC
jgi:hypothetical protein